MKPVYFHADFLQKALLSQRSQGHMILANLLRTVLRAILVIQSLAGVVLSSLFLATLLSDWLRADKEEACCMSSLQLTLAGKSHPWANASLGETLANFRAIGLYEFP